MTPLFQFSIRGLLAAVTILAVGIAALLNANGVWQGAMWGLALYALTAAVLLVVYRREEARAYWLGFAIFGWMYLAVFLTSLVPTPSQAWFRTDPLKHEHLFTTHLANLAHQYLLPASRREQQIAASYPPGQIPDGAPVAGDGSMSMAMMPGGGGMPGGMMSGMMSGMMGGSPGGNAATGGGTLTVMVPNPNYVPVETFAHVVHALCLLLVAAIGGKTCQIIYRTRPTSQE